MYKFKVGDKVIGNDNADREYHVTKKGYKGTVDAVFDDGTIEVDKYKVFADCFDLLSKAKPTPKKPTNFILKYDLDRDPIEEFSTLPEVKKRIQELLTNPSFKKDSVVVYELKHKINIKLSTQISFQTEASRKPTKK